MVFICIESYLFVLQAAGSGVKIGLIVLSGLRMRLFGCVHICISCSYN